MQYRDHAIRRYFGAENDRFWKWQDDGESVGWINGKTIAFAEELSALVQHLSESGLPRFGSLLLLVAATRDTWSVEGSETGILGGMLARQSDSHRFVVSGNNDLLKKVLTGLHRVRDLEPALRTSLEAKMAIAQIVFEDQFSEYSEEESEAICDAIQPGLSTFLDQAVGTVSVGYSPLMLTKDLAGLARGLDRVSAEKVQLRMKTGLDELPGVADLADMPEQLPPNRAVRVLLEELRKSPEHGGLAKVAMRLLACTSLPKQLDLSEEQELGGYSDITNRGTPDRLLLSELAQDGLTLAVRVAMNEAMYLRRETPPSFPKVHREILIDSGVHAWGITRVFSAAAALAFVATSPQGASLNVWRGCDGDLVPTELWTRKGLVDHLSALEANPHLATSLPAFCEQAAESEETVEAILIMPEESYSDEELKRSLDEVKIDRLFVATLSPAGSFQLRQRLNRGEKLIRTARIDLEELLGSKSEIVQKNNQTELPAFFRMHPLPLLLSGDPPPELCWWVEPWGALSISSDGRLLHWTESKQGAEELSAQVPKGKLLWVETDGVDGVVRFAVGGTRKATLLEADLVRKVVTHVRIDCDEVTQVTSHLGAIFCYSEKENLVREIDPKTGAAVRQLVVPIGLRWRRGRFFVDWKGRWHALSHDGQSIRLDVLNQFKTFGDQIAGIWDAAGFEGPLALTVDGRLRSEEMERPRLPRLNAEIYRCQISRISPDGLNVRGICRGLLSNVNYESFEICLGEKPSFEGYFYPRHTHHDPRVGSVIDPVNVRKRFKSIGLTHSGLLALRSQKGGLVGFIVQQGLPLFTVLNHETQLDFEQQFEVQSMEEVRYRIHTASWPSGCQAVLDSRGLLHLKPIHDDISELTVVLAEGALTGWCADGSTFGRKYFLRDLGSYLNAAHRRRELFHDTISRFSEQIRATH